MRTKIMLFALITVVVSLIAASLATAQTTFKFSGPEHRPRNDSRQGRQGRCRGRFTATLNGTTLKWTLTFKNLSGRQRPRISIRRREASPAPLPFRYVPRAHRR